MTAYPYYLATVVRCHHLTPHMIRIGLDGPDLAGFARGAPDQYVKLLFPAAGQAVPTVPALDDDDVESWYRRYLALPDDVRPIMRTYTIRRHRPEAQEVDVDFVVHYDAGPAARWAERAQLGDHVGIIAARGSYQPPVTADWQLIVVDDADPDPRRRRRVRAGLPEADPLAAAAGSGRAAGRDGIRRPGRRARIRGLFGLDLVAAHVNRENSDHSGIEQQLHAGSRFEAPLHRSCVAGGDLLPRIQQIIRLVGGFADQDDPTVEYAQRCRPQRLAVLDRHIGDHGSRVGLPRPTAARAGWGRRWPPHSTATRPPADAAPHHPRAPTRGLAPCKPALLDRAPRARRQEGGRRRVEKRVRDAAANPQFAGRTTSIVGAFWSRCHLGR